MGRLTLIAWIMVGASGVAGTARDAIHDSDLIIVGDVTGASVVDHVANVECSLSIRAGRILKGDSALAHSSIPVHWLYQPRQDQPPDVTMRVERTHGMWFLQKAADGHFEALWVEVNLQNRGGYYLELPEVEPYGAFAYSQDADYETKLAGELGAALEQIAMKQGSRLDMVWRTAGTPGSPPPQPSREVLQFRSLAFAFRELDAAKTSTVCKYLVDSGSAHLKALGLLGELKTGHIEALLEMERNLQALTVTDDPLNLGFWAAGIDIHTNAAAIRAVGRIATGDTELLGFTDLAVGQLSHTGSPAAIPYLEVMLSHPKSEVRDMAAGGICAALRTLANVDFEQASCDSQLTRVDHLKTWLAAHRTQVSSVVPYPLISTPTWYVTPPEPPRHEVEVSLEKRFEHMLLMLSLQTPEQAHDRFVSIGLRTLEPAAEATLDSICAKANMKRKDLDQDYQRIFNDARVHRKDVDPAAMRERATAYMQITADALAESQTQLPGDAWQQLREFLLQLPLHEYSPKSPNAFFEQKPGVRQ